MVYPIYKVNDPTCKILKVLMKPKSNQQDTLASPELPHSLKEQRPAPILLQIYDHTGPLTGYDHTGPLTGHLHARTRPQIKNSTKPILQDLHSCSTDARAILEPILEYRRISQVASHYCVLASMNHAVNPLRVS